MASTDRAARAVLTHSVLAELDRSPRAKDVITKVGEARISKMRQLLSIAWIDLAEHLALVETLHAVIGPEEYTRFWRRVMVQTLGTPLVAGLVRMSTTNGPTRLLSRGQLVHGALTRGTGTLGYEAGAEPETERACVITLSGFPARDHSLKAYADGIAGSILGACDRASVKANVVMHVVSEAKGDVKYDVSWTA
ncbi:MAG: hypothetical protein J0L92_39780 [Deltaproteobacteria bacterium]|nr:hypothetical protein [Deltaproteobacteria bacterium]